MTFRRFRTILISTGRDFDEAYKPPSPPEQAQTRKATTSNWRAGPLIISLRTGNLYGPDKAVNAFGVVTQFASRALSADPIRSRMR